MNLRITRHPTPNVTLTDAATPALVRLARKVKSPKLALEAAGAQVETILHRHFDRKNAQGNKRGWYRSNFWANTVKKATSFTGATDQEAVVTIASKEFIHKLRGGTVRAKSGRMLAIPLTSEAKRLGSPGNWTTKGDGQLIFVKTARGAFLFRNLGFRGRGRMKGQEWELFYKLVASVRHLADETALPTRREMFEGIEQGIRTEFADILKS